MGLSRHQTQLKHWELYGAEAHSAQIAGGTRAYPTDAKEREKERRKTEKEQGIERKVVKRKKVLEDHHDDCGDNMDSLSDLDTTASMMTCRSPYPWDTDEEALSDDDHMECMKMMFGRLNCYPVDLSKVAPAQTGSNPAPGPDPTA